MVRIIPVYSPHFWGYLVPPAALWLKRGCRATDSAPNKLVPAALLASAAPSRTRLHRRPDSCHLSWSPGRDVADPLGSLTPADDPLIKAEICPNKRCHPIASCTRIFGGKFAKDDLVASN